MTTAIFVGGRSIREDRVFVLRMFASDQREDATALYVELVDAYGKQPDEVDLLFGTYPSAEAFFRNEPTWAAQFPTAGDRTFETHGERAAHGMRGI